MVVVSDAGCERDCRRAVRDLGFLTYQPTHRLQIVKNRRKLWTERLLFGRYFFARYVPSLPWAEIPSLRRVSALFMAQPPADWPPSVVPVPEPALVPDARIDALRAMEGPDGHVRLHGCAGNQFKKGQGVRAATGVFAGLRGVFAGQRGSVDVAHMDIMGSATRVEFAPGVLAAA